MNPLSLLPTSWLWPAAAVLGALLLAALGVQTLRLSGAQAARDTAVAQTAVVRGQWAEQRAAVAAATAASQAEFRKTEAALRAQIERGQDEIKATQVRVATVLADARAQLAGVRTAFATYAAGPTSGGGAAADTVAACERRANALGNVLADGLQLQVGLGGSAEREAAAVRGLLIAWPRERERNALIEGANP